MRSRYCLLPVALSVLFLTACSLFDDGPGVIETPRAAPGTVSVSDDWSCVADENGMWDCREPGS